MEDLLTFLGIIFGIGGGITCLWGAWNSFASISTLVGFEVVMAVLSGLFLLFCAVVSATAVWVCFEVGRD